MSKRTKPTPILPKGAEPTQWDKLSSSFMERDIASHRKMTCPFYDRCLDYASTLHWDGWSCKWCSFWKKKGDSPK